MVAVPLNKDLSATTHVANAANNVDVDGDGVEATPTLDKRPLYALPPEGIDLAEVERSFVEQALEMAGGNQSQAARMLGITRFALRSRIKRYHLRDKLKRTDSDVSQ